MTQRKSAPRHLTSLALRLGVLFAVICFVVAGLAEIVGVATVSGDMTDIAALADGLMAFNPWAWAALGTLAIVITPALGLIVSAYEYSTVSDRSSVWLALSVLAVLAIGAVVAVLR
jgi:uncharacterized membrane protein